MTKTKISLTREQLHELVWTKTIKAVAEQCGSSFALVVEACDRLQVPRPAQGYWSLVRFGEPGPRPALPPFLDVQQPSQASEENLSTPEPPLSEISRPPESPEPPKPLHPVARQTRQAYRGGTKDYRYGTVRSKPGMPHVLISVTPGATERALNLLSELASALEGKGFIFARDEKSSRFQLIYSATKTEIEFSMQETFERYQRELTAAEKEKDYVYDQWRYRSTGLLRVVLAEYHPQGARKSWGDGKHQKLENKIGDIAEGFVICAVGNHEIDVAREAERRRWEEEYRLRREAEIRAKAEEARGEELRAAARDWNEAESLRKFRAACEMDLRSHSTEGTLAPGESAWLDWVDARIQGLDPLQNGYLDTVRHSCEAMGAGGE